MHIQAKLGRICEMIMYKESSPGILDFAMEKNNIMVKNLRCVQNVLLYFM